MKIKENILIEAVAKTDDDKIMKAFSEWLEARNAKNEAFASFIINLIK